jgi:DNA-binding NarL/FixJ family response regulator
VALLAHLPAERCRLSFCWNAARMSTSSIRVLCVDDHVLIREGFASIVTREADMEAVGAASSGREGIEQFRALRPDVSLVDIRLPDMSGIAVVEAMRREDRHARILAVSSYEGDVEIQGALSAGALGYVLKGMPRETLLDAIRKVSRGQKAIPAEVAIKLAEHASDEALSAREIEVLTIVATGARNKEIAARLGISEDTVKSHVKTVIAKLGAEDRTGAVTAAIRRGILHE